MTLWGYNEIEVECENCGNSCKILDYNNAPKLCPDCKKNNLIEHLLNPFPKNPLDEVNKLKKELNLLKKNNNLK